MALLKDFPVAPEGHETANIKRSYIKGGYRTETVQDVKH